MCNSSLFIVDSVDKSLVVQSANIGSNFQIIRIEEIVHDFNVLSSLKPERLFFYLDQSMKNKKIILEIVKILNVKQYFMMDPTRDEDVKVLIEDSEIVAYGEIKADFLRKDVDLIYQNNISQMVRWLLFKHRSADPKSIHKVQLKAATPVILGMIADAELKIEEFQKEEYTRVSVEYTVVDNNQTDEESQLPKLISFRLQHKTKFKEEHHEELEIALAKLNNNNIEHKVKDIKRATEEKLPYPPLTTTRLQKNCFYIFNIDPIRSLNICEDLANGILIDGVKTRLITTPYTESHHIKPEVIKEINSLIVNMFGINYLYSGERDYSNLDNEGVTGEAIRPLHFSDKYSPARLKNKIPPMHLEIYKFIYERTVATQMKNSSYDASKLIIEVADIELIGNAHKLEFDGWEKLDGYRQIAAELDEEDMEKEVVFPKNLFMGKVLKPTAVSHFDSKDKNPPRYGKGRLLETIVQENICRPEHAHYVIDSMEKSGLIVERQHMMHPLEIGMVVDRVFREYAPVFRDKKTMQDYEEKIVEVKEEDIESGEVLHDFEVLKREFEVTIGYEENNSEPEQWMIDKAKKVAKFHGEILTDSNPIFYSKQSLLNYINTKESELEKVGRCPECKEDYVVEDSLGFRCISRGCKFVVYKHGRDGKKGGISGFFENFKKPLPEESYQDVMQVLLKSKGEIYFDDLKKKTNETFSAYVVLKKDHNYNSWGLSLSFPKSKKTKISDSLKADTILGAFNQHQKNINADIKQDEVSSKTIPDAEVLDMATFSKNLEYFTKKRILTTTLDIMINEVKDQDNIKTIANEINNILESKKERFRIYKYNDTSIYVLLVGEYLHTDLFELDLEKFLLNDNIQIKITNNK